jgi:hypothetical protein
MSATTTSIVGGFIGKLPTMLATAALGALFNWLLSKNLSTAWLHGGLWMLIIAILGLYLDYNTVMPKLKGLRNIPELLVGFLFFLYNLSIAFWIVVILHGLGLGFDLKMVGWGLRAFLVFVSIMSIVVLSDIASTVEHERTSDPQDDDTNRQGRGKQTEFPIGKRHAG